LAQYVNDRPYAASSFLSVAISRVLASALGGRSKGRPDLAEQDIPLTAMVTPLPCRGSEDVAERLFSPLGYRVSAAGGLLDEAIPEWGPSPYASLRLERCGRLADLLSHLYVLIPVLDNQKHYWVGDDEVEKLLRHGEGWLADHPENQFIAQRYLRHQRSLVRQAMSRLVENESDSQDGERQDEAEGQLEKPIRLNDQRMAKVVEVLEQSGAKRVVDLGCGGGGLLRALLKKSQFEEIVGVDVSAIALERAAERLHLDRMTPRQQARLSLVQSGLTYRDARLEGYDAAALVEVIEHLDPPRLDAFAQVVFGCARPRTVVVTTPNREYNGKFENLPEGGLRHGDHRFEWARAEFQSWARQVGERFGYAVTFHPIGDEDEALGAPTQMGVFTQ
jgi:3' terminal RNA ribose 2'-O-methyltransferase Hen1